MNLHKTDALVAEAMGLCPHLYEYYEPEKTYCETCGMQLTGFYDDDYSSIRCKLCGKKVRGLRYRVNGEPDCKHYTTDWSAAGQVVDFLARQDTPYHLRLQEHWIDEWEAWFIHPINEPSFNSEQLGVIAGTAPLAICLAFLRAMGVEVGE